MFPTHYIRPGQGRVFADATPWLVYGWLTKDGMFTAIDGSKHPAGMAVPINEATRPPETQEA